MAEFNATSVRLTNARKDMFNGGQKAGVFEIKFSSSDLASKPSGSNG